MKSSIKLLGFIAIQTFCLEHFLWANDHNEQYQDIVINNVVVSHGVRECASRYEALKNILNKYKRPITMLDIGASQGYFSFRTAYDYDATCVMVEGDYNNQWHISDNLLTLCQKNSNLEKIIFLKHHLSPEDLEKLAACEHFDVVLAFNVTHHFGKQWKRVAKAILDLGDNIVFENPPAEDKIAGQSGYPKLIEKFLLENGGKIILEIPRHTDPKTKGKMIWCEKSKSKLSSPYWFIKPNNKFKDKYDIKSTYTEKAIFKTVNKKWYTWQPGINLTTFTMLNGVYPTKYAIQYFLHNELAKKCNPNGDLMPWNIIIQGKKLVLIDQDDPRWSRTKEFGLNLTNTFLSQPTPDDAHKFIMKYFRLKKSYQT